MRFILILMLFVVFPNMALGQPIQVSIASDVNEKGRCLLYTSDAADDYSV